jgi:hypothetical protein
MEFMTMDQRFRRGFTAAEKMTGPSEPTRRLAPDMFAIADDVIE